MCVENVADVEWGQLVGWRVLIFEIRCDRFGRDRDRVKFSCSHPALAQLARPRCRTGAAVRFIPAV